jgi:rfaE bifunctional protein kinase chain/domain
MTPATAHGLPLSKATLARLVSSLRDRTIVVLGDVMLDRYIEGDVSRISPEAPVPVVALRSETLRLGGAGNVALNLSALGAKVRMVALVGRDTASRRLRGILDGVGMSSRYLATDRLRPTSVKTRVVAEGQQIVRIDREEPGDAEGSVRSRLLDALRRAVRGADGLVISDYGKGVITAPLLDAVVPLAVGRGLVAVDPKEEHFDLYRGVTVITPNHHEASFIAGRRIRDRSSLVEVGRALRERVGAVSVLITRGAEGMSLFEKKRTTHIGAAAREVYDVTGAGDTVVAVVALSAASGYDLPLSARIANVAAGVAVSHAGAVAVTSAELRRAMTDSPHA